MQVQRLIQGLGTTIGVMAAAPAICAASPVKVPRAVTSARAVVKATDRAPIIETEGGTVVAGHAVYASFSDRRTRLAATYLQGKLVQGTVGTTLYAANGSCFRREARSNFTGLSRIGTSLLPLPSASQRVTYTLRGRTLSWKEAATTRHGSESGVVELDGRDRIVRSDTASYRYGRTKVAAQALQLRYPRSLPRSVPTRVPAPRCRHSA